MAFLNNVTGYLLGYVLLWLACFGPLLWLEDVAAIRSFVSLLAACLIWFKNKKFRLGDFFKQRLSLLSLWFLTVPWELYTRKIVDKKLQYFSCELSRQSLLLWDQQQILYPKESCFLHDACIDLNNHLTICITSLCIGIGVFLSILSLACLLMEVFWPEAVGLSWPLFIKYLLFVMQCSLFVNLLRIVLSVFLGTFSKTAQQFYLWHDVLGCVIIGGQYLFLFFRLRYWMLHQKV